MIQVSEDFNSQEQQAYLYDIYIKVKQLTEQQYQLFNRFKSF